MQRWANPIVGILATRLSNGKPNNRKCKITCHIKSLVMESQRTVALTKMDQADIVSSTHTVRGCHELLLLINGHHIAGSPFPVNVSIHPTQPSKPVNVWTRISSPVGITANSKGAILVALSECPIDIVKYDAEGKRVDIVKKNCLVKPRCIACDDEDNIYCTDVDRGSNKILTCDINGDR